MLEQVLNEMVGEVAGSPRKKDSHKKERETRGCTQRVRGQRNQTSSRPLSRGQAINRKVKMVPLNTSDKINLVITGAEHRALRPHLLERSL